MKIFYWKELLLSMGDLPKRVDYLGLELRSLGYFP